MLNLLEADGAVAEHGIRFLLQRASAGIVMATAGIVMATAGITAVCGYGAALHG